MTSVHKPNINAATYLLQMLRFSSFSH